MNDLSDSQKTNVNDRIQHYEISEEKLKTFFIEGVNEIFITFGIFAYPNVLSLLYELS